MGEKDGKYLVNVKNANPTGMIGDAGVIRYFDSKEEAKNYAKTVNENGTESGIVFKGNSAANIIKEYGKAKPSKGTTALASVSLAAMLPALLASFGVAEKYLNKSKPAQIVISVLAGLGILGTGISIIKADREKRKMVKLLENA